MNTSAQIAKQFRDVHFGGNWTSINLKDTVAGLTWQQAVSKVYGFNSIATLVYHTHYYVAAVSNVLQGEPLNAKDKYSFDLPPIHSQTDWESLLQTVWQTAETFAVQVESFPEERLLQNFEDGKYGNYFRNLTGIIEHLHYHLGQMVLVKKILTEHAVHQQRS